MAYRHRNIPVTSKEEVEIQTDVRMLDNSYFQEQFQGTESRYARSNLRQRDLFQSHTLLRPFSDHELLSNFHTLVREMKDQPYQERTFQKRLEILEHQINGLLKRDYMVNTASEGSQAWKSYYQTLNQKEKTLVRLENEKIYSQLKIAKLHQRITSLEEEVTQLRKSLVHATQAVEENKIYAGFYDKFSKIITGSSQKKSDAEKLFAEEVLPVYDEFDFSMQAITKLINRETTVNTRPVVQSIAKEFDRLLREQQMTEDKVESTVLGLINNFRALKGVSYLSQQFQQAQRTETAENKYKTLLSLFKHEIQKIQVDHPHLKGAENLDWLMRKLEDEKVQLLEVNGWVNLATTNVRVHQVQSEDKKLRNLLGVFATQFKKVYTKFPELHNHCSTYVVQILNSALLSELIQGASLERLKELIIHNVEVVRVEDVYLCDKSKEVNNIHYLKALIQKLLIELKRVKSEHGLDLYLDEALIAMMEVQCKSLDIEDIIEYFRPPARYIEVPIFVENKVYDTVHFEKGVPITRQEPVVIEENKIQVVDINKQVGVFVERAVDVILKEQVPVYITNEKMLQVPTKQEVLTDRIVQTCREVPMIIEKVVPSYEREEVVREVEVDKIVRDIETKEVERVVEVVVQKLVEVQKQTQKIVTINNFKEVIKEVEVKVPHYVNRTEIVEIEKQIPYIIEKEKEVEIRIQVPVEIKVPQLKFIEVFEYRDKPITITNTVEKPVYVELKVQKELIKEVAKEIYIDRSHFIKGDKEEFIREVEVFIDKPIIQEVMVTRDVQIEKVVPLYIKEEVPVLIQVAVPHIQQKVQELEVEKTKIVPARQEVVKQIIVQKPIPVVKEVEIVRVQPEIVEVIVQKIVEVPRIVEIEKIVQKIVVVPRIIDRIVEVPRIIEKIIVVTEKELQIVQIPVPEIIIQNVEVPVEIIVEKQVIIREKEIQFVEVEKIVEVKVYEERPVQIEVEKRIPYEVIREVPVETYRDRIEYQRVEIHETKVQPIEVQVPVIVQEKVPFIVEKEVRTHEVVKEIEFEKLRYEKEKPVVVFEQKLVVQQITKEVPIYHREVVEVPGPEKIVQTIQDKIVEVQVEKLVHVVDYQQKIKEIPIEHDKIIPLICQKLISIPINELVTTPELIQVPRIVNLTHYKEVLVGQPMREQRLETTIVQQVKPMEVIKEVAVEVESTREKIKQLVREVRVELINEVIKEIQTEKEVLIPSETKYVQIPGETIIKELMTESKSTEVVDRSYEKLIEKIVLMPQIVEIVKNIHHISEVNQLGVAVDVDINVHAEKFIGVSTELRKGLIELLSIFRSNAGRQPDLKNLIVIIQKYMKYIDEWIKFPKLVEVVKQVEKEVQIDRPVIVPVENKQRQATLCYMMEKMIAELRRIKEAHRINLNIDEDIHNLFFSQRAVDENIEAKITEMRERIISKQQSFGSRAFLSGAQMEETLRYEAEGLSHRSTIREQQEEIDRLRRVVDGLQSEESSLKAVNQMVVGSNNKLLKTLEKHKQFIDPEQFETNIKIHRNIYDDFIEHRRGTVLSSIERTSKITESAYIVQESSQISSEQKDSYVSQLVSKLNRYEAENQTILKKSKILESEVTRYTDELNVKNSIIKRLENDFESKLSRAREELSKSPNISKDLVDENKKLLDRNRNLEKDLAAEKMNAERAKRQLDRAGESQKRDVARQLERKDRECKDTIEKNQRQFDRELKRLNSEFEKIKKIKEKLDAQIIELRTKHSEEIKAIRQQQLSGATDKHNQLLNENITLRKKYDSLEVDYEKLKNAAADNNTINERETQKLKAELERLRHEERQWTRKHKEGFLDLPEETKLINVKIELQKKIKNMEEDLRKYRNKDESSVGELRSLRDKVKNLEVELEIARKELEATHKMKSTTFHSGYKSGISSTEYMQEGSVMRSPKGPHYRSIEGTGYVSPQSVQSQERERIEQIGSSSSRFSRESGEEKSIYKAQMTLKQFMEMRHGDDKQRDVYMTFVMIKIIEAMENEVSNGVYNSYSPPNIHLFNFDVKHLDKLTVKFGTPITNKNKGNDGLYLSPEVLGGQLASKKSVVFSLGVILDELIHGSLFFRTMEEIQNLQSEFKVRGDKLNPILKNTLFEMMNKEASKRLELIEAKRRLSLQKYITAEGRGSTTSQQRLARSREE